MTKLILFDMKGKMIMQDKMEKERADSKNAVEEYVYEMRDKLSGPLSEFMRESVGSCSHSYLAEGVSCIIV